MPQKGQKISKRQALQNLQQNMAADTQFTREEIGDLLKKFNSELTRNQSKLDRTTFKTLLHREFEFTDDIIMDRVCKAFDQDNDGKVSAEEWCKGMSIFLRGSEDEKLKFAFEVYDMNSDGYITKEEMIHLLKNCLKQQIDEDLDEGVRDLGDLICKKLDADGDGRVSKQDFVKVVGEDPLLLESLGQCMPGEQLVAQFLDSIKTG